MQKKWRAQGYQLKYYGSPFNIHLRWCWDYPGEQNNLRSRVPVGTICVYLLLCATGGEQAMWAITTARSMASQNVGREDSTARGTRDRASVGREYLLAHGEQMMGLGRVETPSSHREPRVQYRKQVSSIFHALLDKCVKQQWAIGFSEWDHQGILHIYYVVCPLCIRFGHFMLFSVKVLSKAWGKSACFISVLIA